MVVLNAVGEEKVNLGELVERTGLPRATAHRLASALVDHDLLRRTTDGRFALGLHLLTLGRHAAEQFPLAERASEALSALRERTQESVQLYVVDGDERVCVAALESPHGLRTIVPVGAALSMERGSAAAALRGELDVPRAGRSGWSSSVQEREPGVASVSAPVRSASGAIVAAVSVSGPIDRMGTHPGDRHGAAVVAAARQIEAAGASA
jgi:DNA-binding IclR family transcriptional regulator